MGAARSTKGELITRWERAPGRQILAALAKILERMQYPGHGRTATDLLHVLEGLPDREEVPGGRDLRGAPLRGCIVGLDLSGWDLSYAQIDLDFVDCDFRGASLDEATGHNVMMLGRLDGASLRRARLTSADFRRVSALGACFDGATLTGSWFEGADLTNASFRDAKCRRARFGLARVVGCDFRRAILDESSFVGARINASTELGGASMRGMNRV